MIFNIKGFKDEKITFLEINMTMGVAYNYEWVHDLYNINHLLFILISSSKVKLYAADIHLTTSDTVSRINIDNCITSTP